jgi:hypothetical protein
MGNRFYGKTGDFKLSNSATNTFLEVLVGCGSKLARTEEEKAIVVWLAYQDQSFRGNSIFDHVAEMGWTAENFDREKPFVLAMIDAAIVEWGAKVDGSAVERAIERWLVPVLASLRQFVVEFSVDEIKEAVDSEWIRDWVRGEGSAFAQCAKHRVYLHPQGCLFCNNGGAFWNNE